MGERARRQCLARSPERGLGEIGSQWQADRLARVLAALRLPRRSPVACAADVRLPAETIGEDSAARLGVKAEPYRAPLPPLLSGRGGLDAGARGGAAKSPISAGLAALSERPGLGARNPMRCA